MSIGPAEIIIVLVIALLVFGPKRLPQMGKSLGKGVREFRKAADTAKEELGLGGVTDQINEVKSTFTEPLKEVTGTFSDLKSSVDVKSAIEAPVAAKDAAAAGRRRRPRGRVRPRVPGAGRGAGRGCRRGGLRDAGGVTAGASDAPSAPDAPSAGSPPESPGVAPPPALRLADAAAPASPATGA